MRGKMNEYTARKSLRVFRVKRTASVWPGPGTRSDSFPAWSRGCHAATARTSRPRLPASKISIALTSRSGPRPSNRFRPQRADRLAARSESARRFCTAPRIVDAEVFSCQPRMLAHPSSSSFWAFGQWISFWTRTSCGTPMQASSFDQPLPPVIGEVTAHEPGGDLRRFDGHFKTIGIRPRPPPGWLRAAGAPCGR